MKSLRDSADIHYCALGIEDDEYIGRCNCKGWQYQNGPCAHLCTLRKAAFLGRIDIEETGGSPDDEHEAVTVADDDDGYYPSNPQLQELYEACLEHATDDLKIYQHRHASSIAQETRQVSKTELADALVPLRQQGFIALGSMPIDLGSEAVDRWRHWHVKPPCADPKQWKYREGKQS